MPDEPQSEETLAQLEREGKVPRGTLARHLVGKMGPTPGEMTAALSYEKERGSGSPKERAGKLGNHLQERAAYYVELEEMLDPDNAPRFQRALTPGELRKGLVTKIQDKIAGRKAEKVRKKAVARKAEAKGGGGGGWEKGPRGGMRKRVGGKWVYQGADGEGGGGKKSIGEKLEESAGKPSKGDKGDDKGGEDGAGDEEEQVLGGPPELGSPDSEHAHPDGPHDSHQTHQGKDLHEAIEHLHTIHPNDLRARGEAIAEAVGKKDPELGKQIKLATHHLADAAQKGKAKREKGQSSLKEDMTAGQALKKLMRDFNSAAAPASILGPEFGGILKDDPKAGKHGDGDMHKEAQAAHDEETAKAKEKAEEMNPDAIAAKEAGKGAVPAVAAKGAKPPPKKPVKKSLTPFGIRARHELSKGGGGPYIGPEGGKWADVAHKIPWKDEHHTEVKEDGRHLATGKSVVMPVTHRKQKTAHFGAQYGQDIEPHGRYVVHGHLGEQGKTVEPGGHKVETIHDTVHFKNPLVIHHKGTGSGPGEWKRRLSDEHGGKKGKALSRALAKKGHDAIITVDKYGTSEIVDLTSFRKSLSKSGSSANVPPLAPPSGSSSQSQRDRTPSLPDFQEIYYQPKTKADEKLEDEQNATRREATARRNKGVFGFHGQARLTTEPVLHYIPVDVPTGKLPRDEKLVAKPKPTKKAKDVKPRLEAGSVHGPAKGGDDDEEDDLKKPKKTGHTPEVGGTKVRKAFVFGDEDELEAMIKAAAKGGKYTKRVPYTDPKTGKRKYRYYYATSSVAREAVEGEEVKLGKDRLKVDKIHEDGSLTITVAGKSRTLSREHYTQLLARHYGHAFYEYADKRAKQAINAVFRHVPKSALEDLKGETLEERLAELKKRVPAVHAKLEASFQRAGVRPTTAKRIISRTLERRGWSKDARAAAIGSVLTKRVKATSFYEVLRGSENLAAGARVESKHVGALVELRQTTPKQPSFEDRIASVAKKAEKELATLKKLLASAQSGDKGATAEALAAALNSNAIAKLNLLTQAFPGLKDKAADEARETLLEVPSVIAGPPKTKGAETIVFVAGENGQPKALKARYVLKEAGDVVASHDPTAGFGKRKDYPAGVQERAYHNDRAEQRKVMNNARRLRGEFVINTNPDAVNGPPMVTEDGHALGGNSRAMSMQLAYHAHPEVAAEMKTYLEEHAHEVGFSTEDVQAMKKPILVRVVEGEHSHEEKKLLVRQMNESFTQAMDPRTMQVAMGRKLDDATLSSLADGMDEGETLAQFLTSSRAQGFVAKLSSAGIIDARNENQYKVAKTGRLNADGRTLVSRILTGRLVGDADVLSNTQPRTIDSVARATPHIVAATKSGAGYDLGSDMATAIRDLNELRQRQADGVTTGVDSAMTPSDFEGFFAQMDLFGGGSGRELESQSNERAKLLLWALIKKPGSQQLATVFKDYAKQAAEHPEAQGGLDFGGGAKVSPTEVLRGVVDRATGRKSREPEPEPEEEAPKDTATVSMF